MIKVYDSGELKKYIEQGEKHFVAGNKKMEVAFKVYDALGFKAASITESTFKANVCGIISDSTLIVLALMFCSTVIAVCLILSGRKGKVRVNPTKGDVEVEVV